MGNMKHAAKIMELLNRNPGASAREIAGNIKLCERSVYRYLRELKKIGYSISSGTDPETSKRKHLLTPVTFTAAEALAMLAASQSFLAQDGLALCNNLKSALCKVEGAIQAGEDIRTYRRMKPHFEYISEKTRDYTPWREIIDKINDAIRYNHSIITLYDSRSAQKATERILDPYDLFWKDGNLYLVAYCHKNKQIRTFRIDRFKSVKKNTLTFMRNPEFDIKKYHDSSFGIWIGTEQTTIRFIVDHPIARLFKESCYHHSQQIEELESGRIVCSFTLYDTPEIRSFLLSWGKYVEVLEPKGLREEIKRELEESLGRYERGGINGI